LFILFLYETIIKIGLTPGLARNLNSGGHLRFRPSCFSIQSSNSTNSPVCKQPTEYYTPATLKMDHTVRRRRRPALSCWECRRRKVKCDHKTPCGHCARNKKHCVYKPFAHDAVAVGSEQRQRAP